MPPATYITITVTEPVLVATGVVLFLTTIAVCAIAIRLLRERNTAIAELIENEAIDERAHTALTAHAAGTYTGVPEIAAHLTDVASGPTYDAADRPDPGSGLWAEFHASAHDGDQP